MTLMSCHRRIAALGLPLPLLLALALGAGTAAAEPSSAARSADSCVGLGPDVTITVSGAYRVKNLDCPAGPWRQANTPTRLNLSNGDYIETRGRESFCVERSGKRAEIKENGRSYCGPAWETRNDPVEW